jgi:hypothetical protein
MYNVVLMLSTLWCAMGHLKSELWSLLSENRKEERERRDAMSCVFGSVGWMNFQLCAAHWNVLKKTLPPCSSLTVIRGWAFYVSLHSDELCTIRGWSVDCMRGFCNHLLLPSGISNTGSKATFHWACLKNLLPITSTGLTKKCVFLKCLTEILFKWRRAFLFFNTVSTVLRSRGVVRCSEVHPVTDWWTPVHQ